MIHYYYGYGKGKTTAAMGLTLRALGRGWRVMVVQFLKNVPSGEILMLETLPNVTVLRGKAGKGFTFNMTDDERIETLRIHNHNLTQGVDAVREGACNMLVLDEVGDAINLKLLNPENLLALLENLPEGAEVVMTGHDPTPALTSLAGYITEMTKHRHPYDAGIPARQGVEY